MEACLNIPEILGVILDYCYSYNTLRSAVLVNRTFQLEAERVLWRQLRFQHKTYLPLGLNTLMQRPALGNHTRSFTVILVGNGLSDSDPLISGLVRDILGLLPYLKSLTILISHLPMSYQDLFPSDPPFQLHSFSLSLPPHPDIIAFLGKQDQIRDLRWTFGFGWHNVPSFPPMFLPNLRSIESPLSLVCALTSTQSLRRVVINRELIYPPELHLPTLPNVTYLQWSDTQDGDARLLSKIFTHAMELHCEHSFSLSNRSSEKLENDLRSMYRFTHKLHSHFHLLQTSRTSVAITLFGFEDLRLDLLGGLPEQSDIIALQDKNPHLTEVATKFVIRGYQEISTWVASLPTNQIGLYTGRNGRYK